MSRKPPLQFDDLTFERFRELARDPELSRYEKIGFPDSYRAGQEQGIFEDICAKLPRLLERNRIVLDIGPGVSDLPGLLLSLCERQGHNILLADSPEMLDQLPDWPHVRKLPGRYPQDCRGLLEELGGRIDVILSYSVIQYVFAEASLFDFLDFSLGLLAPGGQMLLGDIPNISKRKRFFASAAGQAHHRAFTGSDAPMPVTFNHVEPGKIDDSVVLGLLGRVRAAGFDAYVVPQAAGLPMANRREDLLVVRP
jgi:hypothetical protein